LKSHKCRSNGIRRGGPIEDSGSCRKESQLQCSIHSLFGCVFVSSRKPLFDALSWQPGMPGSGPVRLAVRNICFTSYLLLKVLPACKPCPWRYLQVDSSHPDIRAVFAQATNVSIFQSTEFVLDTRPFLSVLHTHSLQEWGPKWWYIVF